MASLESGKAAELKETLLAENTYEMWVKNATYATAALQALVVAALANLPFPRPRCAQARRQRGQG